MDKSSRLILLLGISCSLLLLGGCADLAVRNVGTGSFTGAALKIEGTVYNQGKRAAEESVASFELRVDSTADFMLLGNHDIPPLAAGQEIEIFIPFPQFQLVPSGTCGNLRVCADATNTVNEGIFGGESNNCQMVDYCR